MLEGSQIPAQFGAEQRIDQIMGRLDSFDTDGVARSSAIPSVPGPDGSMQDPKSFKAMVSIMQAQMMSDAFTNDDNDKNKSNPMSSFMDSMMMQNPALAASMSQNPMLANQAFANPMTNSNPMMQMMMMSGQNSNIAMSQMAMMMQNFNQSNVNTQGMVFPVKGEISSDYGKRAHPISGHDHFHSGVDIAAKKGTIIRAPFEGKVVHVGYVQGFGNNTVVIAHENQVQPDGKILYSVFGHNDKALVHKGDHIKQGEIFATVGSEGNSTGPHLHWETRIAPAGIEGTDIFKHEISHTVDPMSLTA